MTSRLCDDSDDEGPAASGDMQRVLSLLDAGSDINETDESGYTGLHRAANNGHVNMVKVLIERMAEVNTLTNRHWTPLYLATKTKQMAVIEALVHGRANVNAADRGGGTCLHLAAGAGNLQMVEYLVQHKADIHLANNSQETPLHRSIDSAEDFDCVRFFVQNGADVNQPNGEGKTPLDLAIWVEASRIQQLLESAPSYVPKQEKDGYARESPALPQCSVPQVMISNLSGESFNFTVAEDETVFALQRRVETHLKLGDDLGVQLFCEESKRVLSGTGPVIHSNLRAVIEKRLPIAVVGKITGALKNPALPRSKKNKPGTPTGGISIVDMKTGNGLREFGFEKPLECIASLPAGLACPSFSETSSVDILDGQSGKVLKTLPTQHLEQVDKIIPFGSGLALSDCMNKLICTVGIDGACKKLSGHENMVLSMAAVGNHLASGDSGSTIRLWDVTAGACISTLDGCHDSAGWVHGLSEIDANVLASCSDTDNNLKLWDLRVPTSPLLIRACSGPEAVCQGPWDVCAIGDGGYVGFATVDTCGIVRAYDLRGAEPLWTRLQEEISNTEALTIASSDGQLISMVGSTIMAWNWRTGDVLNTFSMPSHWCGFSSFILV